MFKKLKNLFKKEVDIQTKRIAIIISDAIAKDNVKVNFSGNRLYVDKDRVIQSVKNDWKKINSKRFKI